MKAFVLFAHGSSVESANDAVRTVAAELASSGGYLVETAFLDPVRPSLNEAVAALAARGTTDIIVIPYFLTLGLHLQRDLPRIVSSAARIHKSVRVQVAPPLDGHPALVEILLDRARQFA